MTQSPFAGVPVDGKVQPVDGGVVFLFALDEWQAFHDTVTGCLSNDEFGKANSKRFLDDRIRRRLCFGLTRQLLSRLLGCRPVDVDIVRPDKGKPSLVGAPFHFSVSHSRTALAIAVAGQPLGVDIEPAEALEDSLALAELFLRESDLEKIRLLSGDEQDQCVRRLWTECEAYLKAKGRGIDDDLQRTIRSAITPSLTTMRDDEDPAEDGTCHVHYLGIHIGHHLSIALSAQQGRSSALVPRVHVEGPASLI